MRARPHRLALVLLAASLPSAAPPASAPRAAPSGELLRAWALEVQGASDGAQGSTSAALAVDLDGETGTDSYTQVPALPACEGTRGGEMWLDCGSTAGEVNR